MEKRYAELSALRMKIRLDQDERLTRQNVVASAALANFRVKSVKVSETTAVERDRLAKAVGYLQKIFDGSTRDIYSLETQNRLNSRGIQELTASIAITRDDIRDFTDQLQRIQPRLREYEVLRAEHQESEELVVKLGDEFDNLRKKVETDSLTASIRRELEAGNRTIADFNRTIDQILNKTSIAQERIAEAKIRVAALETKIARVTAETRILHRSKPALIAAKERLTRDLAQCQTAHGAMGGENELLTKEIEDGLMYGKEPWEIRKELLSLKGEVRALDEIVDQEQKMESILTRPTVRVPALPPRKRFRLIAAENPYP
jgi:chromosome segregation ATPase